MDTSSGKLYRTETEEAYKTLKEKLGDKLKSVSEKDYEFLQTIPEEKRPEELAVREFKESRDKLGAPFSMSIENAFRLGYRAGRKES